MNNLWIDKYKPLNTDNIFGNKMTVLSLKKHLLSLKNNSELNRNILITGITGIGKTSIAKAVLKECNYRIIEFNATNITGASTIKNTVKNSLYHENIIEMFNQDKKKTAILIDEFDALISMGTKGGMTELMSMIKKSEFDTPIIFTSKDIRHAKLTELRKIVKEFKLKQLTKIDKEQLLTKIIKDENLNFDFDALIMYVKKLDNDVRTIINDLQYLCTGNKHITIDNLSILMDKDKNNIQDQDIQLFDGVNSLFYKKDLSNFEAETIYEMDTFFIPLLIHENYISSLYGIKKADKTTSSELFKKIKNLSDCVAYHDYINTYIFSNCKWDINQYLPYIHTKPINNILTDYNKKTEIQFKWTTMFGNISLHHRNLKKGVGFAMSLDKNILKYYDAVQLLKMAKYYILIDGNFDILIKDILMYYSITYSELEILFRLDQELNKEIKTKIRTQLKKCFKKYYS